MSLRNTPSRWGSVAQAIHWSTVALIIAQFALGLIAGQLPLGMEKVVTLSRHKSIGMTILALAVMRVIWRALNPAPPLPEMRRHEKWLAHFSHRALYVLLFAMPVSGWLMSSARNFPVSWFGVFQLPDLVSPNATLYDLTNSAHEVLAIAMGSIALLHAAAALKHHFVDKDTVLRRMLPFGRER